MRTTGLVIDVIIYSNKISLCSSVMCIVSISTVCIYNGPIRS